MEEKKEYIDLREVARELLSRKKLFIKTLTVAFILSCVWIYPQPRYYTAEVTLAPEMENIAGGGGLSDIAASFGFDLGGGSVGDAIYPTLYPDVIGSREFIIRLFDVKVQTSDGAVETDYFTYLTKHQAHNPYTFPYYWIRRQIRNLTSTPKTTPATGRNTGARFDAFSLSEDQNAVVELVQQMVKCDVDLKTNVISISVEDQDAYICACMADTVRVLLQDYIIDYRTKKARNDVEYYEKLVAEAEVEYSRAIEQYDKYSDSHMNLLLQTNKSEQDRLYNNAEIAYQSYTTMMTQLQAAKARLQERTPSFSVLQSSTIPQKPYKPKRMIFVLGMMFVTMIGTAIYIFKDGIIKQLLS